MSRNLISYYLFLSLVLWVNYSFAQEEDLERPKIEKKRESSDKRTKKKIDISPFLVTGCGWQSNVFHSPENVIGSKTYGTLMDLEKKVFFFFYEAGFDLRWKLYKTDNLKFSYQYEGTNYTTYTVLNNFAHKIDFTWEHKFTNMLILKLNSDFETQTKKATNVFGIELSQKYSYNKFSLGPALTYKIVPLFGSIYEKLGTTDIKFSYDWDIKDYEEPGQPNYSLDYIQDNFAIDLVQKITKILRLKFGYDQKYRKYQKDLAITAQGIYNSLNVKREQNYANIFLSIGMEFNKNNNLELGYSSKNRLDPYQDYYTYNAKVVSSKGEYKLTATTQLTAKLEYELREYKVQTAPVVGPNPLLTKKYFDFYFGVSQRVTDFLSVYLQYMLQTRDTNTELSWWTTDRDYKDNVVNLGVQINF